MCYVCVTVTVPLPVTETISASMTLAMTVALTVALTEVFGLTVHRTSCDFDDAYLCLQMFI